MMLSDKVSSEADKVMSKYPNRYPVIVQTNDKQLQKQIKKNKFLVPGDISVGYLMHVIRKQITLDSSEAIFLFCNNKMITNTAMINQIYDENKAIDKFLYLKICKEATFG